MCAKKIHHNFFEKLLFEKKYNNSSDATVSYETSSLCNISQFERGSGIV